MKIEFIIRLSNSYEGTNSLTSSTQSTEAVEYNDFIFAVGKNPFNNKLYDVKLSDGIPWEMWGTPSLTLFQGSLSTGQVAPYSVLSLGQIELFLNFMLIFLPAPPILSMHE